MGTRRDRLRRRARQQAAVADLGRRALIGEPFAALPQLAAETAVSALDANFAAIFERAEADRLRLVANVGGPPDLVGTVRPDTGPGTPLGETLARGEPIVIDDWANEERFVSPPLVTEHGIASSASVVIRGPERLAHGVLAVYSVTPRAFDADDVLFLRGVANVLGAAIARHATEETLRGREAEARLAMDVGRMGSWRWDPVTNGVSWSPELEGLYGLALGSFGGDFDSFLGLVHPDDRARTVEVISHGAETGTEIDFEHRAVRPDGSVVWVHGRGRPLRDEDGSIIQWIGVGIDVTESKRAGAERERLLELEHAAREKAQRSNRELAETVARLDALLENAPVAFGFCDTRFRFVRVNEKLAAISGRPVDEHLGHPIEELLPELWPSLEAALRSVLTDGRAVVDHESGGLTPSRPGVERYWLSSFYPINDPKGDLLGIGMVVVEITDRRRAELAARIVAAASELVATAPDLDTVLARAATVALGEFADSCHVYLKTDARDRRRVGIAHVDAHVEALLRDGDEKYPLEVEHHPALAATLERGQPLLLSSVTAKMQEQLAASAEELELIQAHGVVSAILVPLVVRGTPLGLLLLNHTNTSGRHYVDGDVALAAELGRRIAVAIENAQLAAVAERNSAWLTLLARAGELLEVALDSSARIEALARLVLGTFADVCAVYLVEDGEYARLAAFARDDTEGERELAAPSEWPPTRLDSDTPFAVAIRENRPVLVARTDGPGVEALHLDDERQKVAQDVGVRSLLVVPLPGPNGPLGALGFGFVHSGRGYTVEDISLATELARRSGPAVEHALRFEQEQATAQTLQRSLLPERLPVVPRLQLAARYLAGTEGLKVGGDWYDVIALPDGRVLLAIGDVAGHGVRAAAAMGRIRHALQFCAHETAAPADMLERLNRHFCSVRDSEMATLLIAVLDPDLRRVEYSSAGHPPAFLRRGADAPEPLAGGRGMPICASERAGYAGAELTIRDGDLLLLYTDGLIERRGESLDVGLERLAASIADEHGDLDALVDGLIDRMDVRRERDDDVAVLAVRIENTRSGHLELVLAAEPTELARLRRALRDWLTEEGVPVEERDNMIVAVNEVAANAVEHAYGIRDESFAIHATLQAGELVVTVTDTGRWRAPRPHQTRGRGLDLARALMDDVELHHDEHGTVVTLQRRLDERDLDRNPEAGR